MRLLTIAGRFFQKMENRLLRKQSEGWKGWGQIADKQLIARLEDNARRKDWVDVANLALILWANENKHQAED